MDSEFDKVLLDNIGKFVNKHLDIFEKENVYGFAFVYADEGTALSCAIGTYERLTEVVNEYIKLGYKNTETNNYDEFPDWLKWSSPEEGWGGLSSDSFTELNNLLLELIKSKKVKLFSDYLRKRILKNIKNIRQIVPQSKECVFLFSNGYFSLELKNYNRRINTTDNYLIWQNEQHNTERLNDIIKKL